jgi:Lrp/AsnC family transcriptional regulator for asnA, asnC and gidA
MNQAMNTGQVPRKQSAYELDTTDYALIELLRVDGRMSFRDIAAKLSLTEATVRKRVRRLEDSDSIRVVAVSDMEAAGFGMLLAIGVEVEARSSTDVAQDLAKIGQVYSACVVVGSHDVEILLLARDQEQLNELLQQLGSIPGVRRLLPSLALDVIKNEPHWVPFHNEVPA